MTYENSGIYDNIMVDLETFGRKSNTIILSVAMVGFNRKTGETGHEFFSPVSIDDQFFNYNSSINGDTIKWWLRQDHEARMKIVEYDNVKVADVVSAMDEYFSNFDKNSVKIWGNGSSFDLPKLSNLYEILGREKPWMFYNERDVRTEIDGYEHIKLAEPFIGIKHDPIDDAKHQIKYCCKIYNKKNNKI